jgi:hypothetical protein
MGSERHHAIVRRHQIRELLGIDGLGVLAGEVVL